ncbi:hypothetical protein Bbelb_120110 [Branchiostoma belcheri]|nr:hypothetical protein Bbelb_120110 [Branchiostoma belcheri]
MRTLNPLVHLDSKLQYSGDAQTRPVAEKRTNIRTARSRVCEGGPGPAVFGAGLVLVPPGWVPGDGPNRACLVLYLNGLGLGSGKVLDSLRVSKNVDLPQALFWIRVDYLEAYLSIARILQSGQADRAQALALTASRSLVEAIVLPTRVACKNMNSAPMTSQMTSEPLSRPPCRTFGTIPDVGGFIIEYRRESSKQIAETVLGALCSMPSQPYK